MSAEDPHGKLPSGAGRLWYHRWRTTDSEIRIPTPSDGPQERWDVLRSDDEDGEELIGGDGPAGPHFDGGRPGKRRSGRTVVLMVVAVATVTVVGGSAMAALATVIAHEHRPIQVTITMPGSFALGVLAGA